MDVMPVEAAVAAGTMEITVSKVRIAAGIDGDARRGRAQDHDSDSVQLSI